MLEFYERIMSSVSVSSLKSASNRAIGVFSKTIDELNEINSKIKVQKELKMTKIDELQTECNSLNEQEQYNTKIVEKIESILN